MSAVLVEWVLPNMKGKSVCEKAAGTGGRVKDALIEARGWTLRQLPILRNRRRTGTSRYAVSGYRTPLGLGLQYRRRRDDADGLEGVVQEKTCGETSSDIRPYTERMRAYLWLFGTLAAADQARARRTPRFSRRYLNNSRDLRPTIARTIVCVIGESRRGQLDGEGKRGRHYGGSEASAGQGSFWSLFRCRPQSSGIGIFTD